MDTEFPSINNPELARLRRQSAQRKLRKRTRKVRLLWTVAGVLLLALVAEVVVALCSSPRFWIYRITVANEETLTEAQVIRLMNLPAHSNYYRAPLGKLARRIETEPRVAKAVVKHGAIGTLAVHIRERQAVAQLGTTSPTLYMDAQGIVFTRPAPPKRPVPVIEGIAVPAPEEALGKPAAFPQVKAVRACLQELRESLDSGQLQIKRLVVTPRGSFNLVLEQGTLIFLGHPAYLREKVQHLQQAILLASNGGHALEQLEYINVDFVNDKTAEAGICAIIRPKNQAEEAVGP